LRAACHVRLSKGDVVIIPGRAAWVGGVSKETYLLIVRSDPDKNSTEVARDAIATPIGKVALRESHIPIRRLGSAALALRRVRARRAPQPESELFTPIWCKALTTSQHVGFIKAAAEESRSFRVAHPTHSKRKHSGGIW